MANQIDAIIHEIHETDAPSGSGRMRFAALIHASRSRAAQVIIGKLGCFLYASGGMESLERTFALTDLSVNDNEPTTLRKIVDLLNAMNVDSPTMGTLLRGISDHAMQEIGAVIKNNYPRRLGK